jgi:hypothetical protein
MYPSAIIIRIEAVYEENAECVHQHSITRSVNQASCQLQLLRLKAVNAKRACYEAR